MTCEFGNFPVMDSWWDFVLLQYHATIGLSLFCFVDGASTFKMFIFGNTLTILERRAAVDSTPQSTLNGPI